MDNLLQRVRRVVRRGEGGRTPLPSISRARSCRMVASPGRNWNACRVPSPVSAVEGATDETTSQTLLDSSGVPLCSHRSCHCYCVTFLTRPSRVRGQRRHLADSPRARRAASPPPQGFAHPGTFMHQVWKSFGYVVPSCFGGLLKGAPSGPRSAGTQPCSSVHPAASPISCRTAPPAETTPP